MSFSIIKYKGDYEFEDRNVSYVARFKYLIEIAILKHKEFFICGHMKLPTSCPVDREFSTRNTPYFPPTHINILETKQSAKKYVCVFEGHADEIFTAIILFNKATNILYFHCGSEKMEFHKVVKVTDSYILCWRQRELRKYDLFLNKIDIIPRKEIFNMLMKGMPVEELIPKYILKRFAKLTTMKLPRAIIFTILLKVKYSTYYI
jgi:hypothetical protein